MDAKRTFRANSTITNENMAPVAFANNHQRTKSTGVPISKDALKDIGVMPVKPATKRTAFGDVSNVVRHVDSNAAVFGFKAATVADGHKAGLVSTAPMPAPPPPAHAKDTVGQPASTNGFLAPAQRPRNSIAPISSVPITQTNTQNLLRQAPAPVQIYATGTFQPTGKTQIGPIRKATFVTSRDVHVDGAPAVARPEVAINADDAGDSAIAKWDKPKRSPRHSKSQPCLKNADGLQQQKKPLRRTLSRLPIDRSNFMDVVVFADADKSAAHSPIIESESIEQQIAQSIAEPMSKPEEACNNVVDRGHSVAPGIVHNNDGGDANEAPFVDAVENFHPTNLPPLSDGSDDDIGRLREEIEAAVLETEEHLRPVEDHASYVPLVEPTPAEFMTSMPAVTMASAMSEVEEPWDDDADFYDDQAYTTAHSFRSLGDTTTGALTTVVMPKMTAKIQNELDMARAIVEEAGIPEELDDEAWDISMVAEYGDDINAYMRELELRMLPSAHYMDQQTEIQWSMRSVLMEWLIQVHSRFNLLPETLFLTVNYVDRFLSTKIVSVAKLQLVGATAIFIAAKYEEIICPSIEEIIYMVDGGYKKEEILKAERFMLSMLGFELGWPGPMSFLRRISKADEYDLDTRTLAKYFLEVTVMDERFVACPPSFLAAGAHCLARMMLYKGNWVRPLANTILHCCRHPGTHHAVVYDKYAHVKFKRAAVYVENEIRRGYQLPPLQAYHHSRHHLSFTDSLTDLDVDTSAAAPPDCSNAHQDMHIYAKA
ncbi:g2 mitotic-specific cyclin [Sporothrix brasiliensis 5110]|uniref:G2 mitotic-specific cyclin n=1 Tax=Sporothrix brasiliensis 5110 TaxID=1398154 RepID=A0A0C2ELG0_9PEZI|nr:g2 mitotic-specific cyclin [Sporothrix brasiliensis 5110]KIH86949.1 g2 mitotic-specific cyclin [Sporothrix brasiliensis 5110]